MKKSIVLSAALLILASATAAKADISVSIGTVPEYYYVEPGYYQYYYAPNPWPVARYERRVYRHNEYWARQYHDHRDNRRDWDRDRKHDNRPHR